MVEVVVVVVGEVVLDGEDDNEVEVLGWRVGRMGEAVMRGARKARRARWWGACILLWVCCVCGRDFRSWAFVVMGVLYEKRREREMGKGGCGRNI